MLTPAWAVDEGEKDEEASGVPTPLGGATVADCGGARGLTGGTEGPWVAAAASAAREPAAGPSARWNQAAKVNSARAPACSHHKRI